MPITPLHFGLMAPINLFVKNKVSNVSFVLANLWMDAPSIFYAIFGVGDYSHTNHTMINAVAIAGLISCFGYRERDWVLGAFFGTITHVLLDALVHSDVQPFDWIAGNPMYIGLMDSISLALLPLAVIWGAQCMSYIRESFAKH